MQAGDDLSDRLAVVVGGGAAHRPVGPAHGLTRGFADRFASGFGVRHFRFESFGRFASGGRGRGEPALKARLLLLLGILDRLDGFPGPGRLLFLAELERFLDRGKRRFGRILVFLRCFRHFRRRLRSVLTTIGDTPLGPKPRTYKIPWSPPG